MKPGKIVLGLLVASLVLCIVHSAFAQGYQPRWPRYGASGQSFSPWFGLFQQNTGVLDNYHTYVQPEIQLRNVLRNQNMVLRQQQGLIQQQNEAFRTMQQGSMGGQAGQLSPAGMMSGRMTHGAWFMTHGTYYGR